MPASSIALADAATARETRQTYEPNQWRELVKAARPRVHRRRDAPGARLLPKSPAAHHHHRAPPPPEILPCAQHTFITIVLPSVVNPQEA